MGGGFHPIIWLCPRFTSNNKENDSWKVTSGSEYDTRWNCGKVFNGDFTSVENNGWAGSPNNSSDWLLVQSKSKKVKVKKVYILSTYDGSTNGFDNFKLYGSNDNVTFTLLYESNIPLRYADGGRYYDINNNQSYYYYKFTFETSYSYVFIAQIAMFSDSNADISMSYDG